MGDRPHNILQFRNPPQKDRPDVYMGGTTIGCGDPRFSHKRHRWEQEQSGCKMCRNCGLTKGPFE